MTIEKLIANLQGGAAPKFYVVIVGHDSENNEILFEPYSVRWESGAVVIEADLTSRDRLPVSTLNVS
jgi:hypothetical protein